MQRVLLVADDDGVAGVVAAVVLDHEVDLVAKQVGGLAFALVAPLGSEQHDRRHTASLRTTKAPLRCMILGEECKRRGASCDERLLDLAELRDCFGVAVTQEGRAARGLVLLTDGCRGPGKAV